MPARRKERPKPANPPGSSSKKIIAYALIGILAVGAVSVVAFAPRPPAPDPQAESVLQAILQFQERFCGLGSDARSTNYVTEYVLPGKCEVPLGIEVHGNQVWYTSTKNGTLGTYNIAEAEFGPEYRVPSWPASSSPTGLSMTWSTKADNDGNIWFTDEAQRSLWRFDVSERSFDTFPVSARLPVSIDFDAQGNIYFIGVQSTSLFVGNTSEMRDGMSSGINEVALPLGGFAGITAGQVNSGGLAVDRQNNDVWVSLLSFQRKGQLVQYDIDSKNITRVVDLPSDITSPVGLALDGDGNLWVTDHGTNIFFRYELASQEITKFVTSVASPRIHAGRELPDAYTLPYWIEKSPDTSLLWFNQHTGNKIASFDPATLTLTEYWVPTQNSKWAVCPEDSDVACGLANAMQISSGPGGHVWFTEWTENKIARVDSSKPAPVSVSILQDEVIVARGTSIEIPVTFEARSAFAGSPIASSSLTPNGLLGNSTGIFSEEEISLQAGEGTQISYTFTAAGSTDPGKYTLMLGVENNEISVLKAVIVNVV